MGERGANASDEAGSAPRTASDRVATVAEVVSAVESLCPPALAEPWDTGIGLTTGDPGDSVRHVHLAVDVTPAVVTEALEVGAQLLLSHHPVLFRPVQSIAVGQGSGGLLHGAVRSGLAIMSAHTNADSARPGVSDALARTLGLTPGPALQLAPGSSDGGEYGLGRLCDLPDPMSLRDLADLVTARLPLAAGGLRVAGAGSRPVRRLAVCGGAGGDLIRAALNHGADAYLTADLRHHVTSDAAAAGLALLDAGHWTTERPWLDLMAAALRDGPGGMPRVEVSVSELVTDPWTWRS